MAADLSPVGLRVLREVAQTGSFSAAALSLGYTQSAISRQVAALEALAERRLFDRGRHGVTLTPAGTCLLTSAIRVLAVLARTPLFRPLDAESPALELTTLSERELAIGVLANHLLARAEAVEVEE